MRHNKIILTTLSIAIASLLTACGGGGGDSSSNPPTQNGKSFSGVAVDFYLQNATVQLNDCNNYKVTNATDSQGNFNFTLPSGCIESALTITGGIDSVTGKAFTGTLKVKRLSLENINNAVASPLTTLQAILSESDFKEVLKNLGFSENTDVTTFNPVIQGSAEQLATVFLIQQLLTQIEDAIEKSGGTADAATTIAAQALGNIIKEEKLINNGAYNSSLFADIVAEAESLVPFSIDTTSISSNVTAISNAVTTVGLSGNGSALVTALTSQTNSAILGTIRDSIPAAPVIPQINTEFTKLEIGGYTLQQFKNSSSAAPIQLEKSEFSNILKVNLLLAAPKVNEHETATIGLNVSAGQETLDLVLQSVDIYFDGLGRPTRAVLPANSSIKVDSTVQALGQYKNITLIPNQNIELTINNGVIDLGSFVVEEQKLQNVFNNYYNTIVASGVATTEVYVKLNKYNASTNFGLTKRNGSILNTAFTDAYNVIGYFKFNPVTPTP